MSLQLPVLVSHYVEAQNAHDHDALLACFAEDAVVRDEGGVHRGQDEIRAWIVDTSERYRVTMEPTGYAESDSAAVLTAQVSGTFLGSPVVLHFHLMLEGGRISALEVHA